MVCAFEWSSPNILRLGKNVTNYSSDILDFFRHIDLTAPWWKNPAYSPVNILGHAYRNLSLRGGGGEGVFLIYTKNMFALVWFSLNMEHRVLWFSVKYHNYLSNTILSCFNILYINCLQVMAGGGEGVVLNR
jgi:hypothetical protein